MSSPEDPVYPVSGSDYDHYGLTKREYVACRLHAALLTGIGSAIGSAVLTKPDRLDDPEVEPAIKATMARAADEAIQAADALLAKLAQPAAETVDTCPPHSTQQAPQSEETQP